MKKKIIGAVIGLAMLITFPAVAETVNVYQNNKLVESVVFKINVPKYVVNDQTIVKMDVAPFIQSDRTFVPVRFLGNALSVDDSNITWDQGSQTAILKGNAMLQMTIGKAQITSNGVAKSIDVAPMLTNDRTFLPARYVAEGLGYQVDWDNATQTVVCWPAGQTKPDVSASVDYLNGQVQQQTVTSTDTSKPAIVSSIENILVGAKVYPPGKYDKGWGYIVKNRLEIDYVGYDSKDGEIHIHLKTGAVDEDLYKVKEVIKLFFPESYETVFELTQSAIKAKQANNGYDSQKEYNYDNRSLAINAFENDITGIYVVINKEGR